MRRTDPVGQPLERYIPKNARQLAEFQDEREPPKVGRDILPRAHIRTYSQSGEVFDFALVELRAGSDPSRIEGRMLELMRGGRLAERYVADADGRVTGYERYEDAFET